MDNQCKRHRFIGVDGYCKYCGTTFLECAKMEAARDAAQIKELESDRDELLCTKKILESQIDSIRKELIVFQHALDIAASEKAQDGNCPGELGELLPICNEQGDKECTLTNSETINCWKLYFMKKAARVIQGTNIHQLPLSINEEVNLKW